MSSPDVRAMEHPYRTATRAREAEHYAAAWRKRTRRIWALGLAWGGFVPLAFPLVVLFHQWFDIDTASTIALTLAIIPTVVASVLFLSFRCPRCNYPFNLRWNTFTGRGCERCELQPGEIPPEHLRTRVAANHPLEMEQLQCPGELAEDEERPSMPERQKARPQ